MDINRELWCELILNWSELHLLSWIVASKFKLNYGKIIWFRISAVKQLLTIVTIRTQVPQ